MNGMWLVIAWAPLGSAVLFVVWLLAAAVFGSRDRMPEHDGPVFAPTWQIPPERVTQPIPPVRIFEPAIPPLVRAEGYPIGARLGFTRTVMEPTPLEPAWIYETLRTEWAALVYAREAALRNPTQEFAVIMGATWTAAELETLAALELPCSHCGVDLDHRADYPADHRACPGCACPCTVVSLEPELSHA